MNAIGLYPEPVLIAEGKVREIYEIAPDRIVLVASDRVPAFDEVLDGGIPGKGVVLTQLSAFWAQKMGSLVPNAWITVTHNEISHPYFHDEKFAGRVTEQEKLRMIPLEVIVRGYITGSAWKDYKNGTREICSIPLPEGLQNSEKFSQPIITPTTKAPVGEHDQNVSLAQAIQHLMDLQFDAGTIGVDDLVGGLYDYARTLYNYAAEYALERGIIIADTKFEFGLNGNGDVVLADEILTPDSSRFWAASEYEVGREQKSFDKQIIRDCVAEQKALGVEQVRIPPEIVEETARRYRECFEILTVGW